MRRRGEREQIDHHPFVVAVPAARDQAGAGFRVPAHADEPVRARQEGPVDALVHADPELPDLRLVRGGTVEIGGGGERAEQEQGGVDARQLDGLEPPRGLHVEEVVEEAVVPGDPDGGVALGAVPDGAEREERLLRRGGTRDVAALDPDRKRGQREAEGGDRAEIRVRPIVRREAGVGVGSLPEVAEGAVVEVGEDGVERATGTSHARQRRSDGERRHRSRHQSSSIPVDPLAHAPSPEVRSFRNCTSTPPGSCANRCRPALLP